MKSSDKSSDNGRETLKTTFYYQTYEQAEFLRVVHTQAILFWKSMSERGGSDIERL